ncbi:hypothetical protein [Leclercia adecarboxylata]|uniref:hypothetical protein n=1 Tax=Leclercia adecarboxylata TaxID=83655 RepID=UPI0011A11B20|nr:hypothetical protein [Leclercia adecarboxylata]
MTTSKPMTGEQLDELMTVAVRMQRDAEVDRNFPSANFAYAVQVAVLELRRTREISSALAAENAGLKKYICDECYVENVSTGRYACAGHGMPSTPATHSFLADVRAQGVEMFAREMHADISEADAIEFAAQLRQDANTAELVAAGIITRIEG